ncbi:hypothetical protein B5G52_04120 [Pseudoalteromonas sp. A601]|uniref:hypothetical protein n=1 Tax=Pseudoalteromonas sp. A601 TaxID=1967839 RepID=UPI000B3BEC3A|nr:hypothetical protein [Pseudoalteromonas sp. A601]OUS73439.1 hypothetical protein B5G52_04120 [Pseudoalteromonas sp. A601]
MASKNVIDEYFIKISADAKGVNNDVNKALEKIFANSKKMNEKLSSLEVKLKSNTIKTKERLDKNAAKNEERLLNQTHKKKTENIKKATAAITNSHNKELAQMRKYYKQQEKRSAAAHDITENMKSQLRYGKLSTSQQDKLNKKLEQASKTLIRTGSRSLFSEARRDMTMMSRQSGVIAKNMKRAADERLQARADFAQSAGSAARVGAVAAGGAVALATRKLLEVGKSQDKLISVFESTYGSKGTAKLADLQNFIAKSGGSLEQSSDALASAIPVMQKRLGDQAIPFFKDLTKVFAASNVSAGDQSEIIRQVLQAQDGTVTKSDLNPIFDRLPLFANFLNDFTKNRYGKTVKEMTAQSLLTSKMMNQAFRSFAKSNEVNTLYAKNQSSMSNQSAKLSNSIYKRWLEVYDDEGGALKKAMGELTKTVNSREGKAAFKGLASLLGGVYDTTSNIVRFSGSMLDSSTGLIESFSKLESTSSKVAVGLAGMYAGKKAFDISNGIWKMFKPLKAMNVNAGIVNLNSVDGTGGKKGKLSKAASKAGGMAKTGLLAGAGFAPALAALAAPIAIQAASINKNKDKILENAREGGLGGRAENALLRADAARQQFESNRALANQVVANTPAAAHIKPSANSTKIINNNPTINIEARNSDDIKQALDEYSWIGWGR